MEGKNSYNKLVIFLIFMKKYFFIIAFLFCFFLWVPIALGCTNANDCSDSPGMGMHFECINSSCQAVSDVGGTSWPPKVAKSDVNSCCQLSHTIKFDGITFKKGCIVGAIKDSPGAYCVLNGTNLIDKLNVEPNNNLSTGLDPCNFTEPISAYKKWGMLCLVSTIYSITDWMFFIMLTVAVFMFALAGFFYLTALGDPSKVSKANNTMVYAIIGLLIALVSKMVPSIVLMAVK
jgi:hypothetical protein